MRFVISAAIKGYGTDPDVIYCFDPSVVVYRLRQAFPEVEVDSKDISWRDYEGLKRAGAIADTLKIAERDAQRRGPRWAFRLPVPTKSPIKGRAERYIVSISSDEPIPEPVRSRFLRFLEELRFGPHVSVKSLRVEGNDEFPA